MDIKTDFLAEEWFDFLKEKVEPSFHGVMFYTYTPEACGDLRGFAHYSPKIGVNIDDKEVFKQRLKGLAVEVTKHTVEESLQRHVYETANKFMYTR